MKFFILTGDSAATGRGVVPIRVMTASSATLSGLGLVRDFMAIPPLGTKATRSALS
jgi:hypothetical protein